MKKVLLKWDNTIWEIVKETAYGSFIIKSKSAELMKVQLDEIILIND